MLELMEITTQNKDGVAMADQYEKIINCIEAEYHCQVIYFTTDADGGSKKGHKILVKCMMQREIFLNLLPVLSGGSTIMGKFAICSMKLKNRSVSIAWATWLSLLTLSQTSHDGQLIALHSSTFIPSKTHSSSLYCSSREWSSKLKLVWQHPQRSLLCKPMWKSIAISYLTHHSGMDLKLLLVTLNPSAMQPTSIKQTAHAQIKYCSLLLGCISTLPSTQSPQPKMVWRNSSRNNGRTVTSPSFFSHWSSTHLRVCHVSESNQVWVTFDVILC